MAAQSALTRASRWLPAGGTTTRAAVRVFCVPHAGGGGSSFRSWVRQSPPTAEICPVQLPGRESRLDEPLPASITEVADELSVVLLPYLDVPYVLAGNSMGALIAAELALRLQRDYQLPPAHLIVAATWPPGTAQAKPGPRVSHLDDAEFTAVIQQRYGSVPADVLTSPELLAVFLPALRADMRMFETYRPDLSDLLLSCPVTAVLGTGDTTLTAADMAGWSALTTGPFSCVEVAGGHLALLDHAQEVLAPVCAQAEQVLPDDRRAHGGP